MTTRLVLIAQGATSAARRSAFPADEPLEDKAVAALAGTPPPQWRGGAAFVSPAVAARQTAEALGLTATADAALGDLDAGRWAGLTLAEIATTAPEALAQWLADPGFDGHGGESRAALGARATAWLAARTTGGQVVAVTHAAVIRAMVLAVLDAPAGAFWRLDIAPLTQTELRHDGRRWALRRSGCAIGGADPG